MAQNRQMAYVGLAALGGVAVAMLAGKQNWGRAKQALGLAPYRAIDDETYRIQSGDRREQSPESIQERDKKIFAGEVQRRW